MAIKLVASTGEQASSILVFAAAPLTLLTALSKSSLGKKVQEALAERLPGLEAEAERMRQAHAGEQHPRPPFAPHSLPWLALLASTIVW